MSEDDARALQAAMRQAVEGDLGGSSRPGPRWTGVPTAGKSGTAELGGTGEPHSWFIGFAPVDDPRSPSRCWWSGADAAWEPAAPLAGALMDAVLRALREAVIGERAQLRGGRLHPEPRRVGGPGYARYARATSTEAAIRRRR